MPSTQKTFLTNLVLLLSLNFLVKPFWIFFIDRNIQNIVGTTEYGFYFSLMNFSLVFSVLLDLGINNFNNRNIAKYPVLLPKYFSHLVPVKLLLGIVYISVSLLIALIVGYNSRQFFFLFVLLLSQFAQYLVLYFRTNFSGLHLFKTDSLLSVSDKFFMILICGALLLQYKTSHIFKIEWLIYAQLISSSITIVLCLFFTSKHLNVFHFRFNYRFILLIVRQSYPFAILIILMMLNLRMDTILLERILPDGKTQAGIYAQSYRIYDAISMVPLLFGGLLLPIFSRQIINKENVAEIVHLSFILVFVPIFIFSVFSFFYKEQIIQTLYTSHVDESVPVFGFIVLNLINSAISVIFGTLLTANGSIKHLNYITLGGLFFTLLLNFILIPYYKALGTAIISFGVQCLINIFQYYFASKFFPFKVNFRFIVKLITFIVFILLFASFAKDTSLKWYWFYFCGMFVSFIVALVVKLINIKEIRTIFNAR